MHCAILGAILFAVVVIALKMGAVPVSLYGLVRDLFHVALGQASQLSSEHQLIVFNIRLPRIFLSIFVGASLSVAGASFQALLRNPLADPYVLGVSSGASVGAILALIIELRLALAPAIAALFTPVGAFLLAGIISASFLSAIIQFFMSTLTGGNYHGFAFWMMGDLSTPQQPIVNWIV